LQRISSAISAESIPADYGGQPNPGCNFPRHPLQSFCNTEGALMPVLTDSEIQQALASLQGWQRNGKAIQRVFRFPDFKAAMAFVNKIADAAEQANHHPDIDIRYNTITMALVSHDSGGVTQRDVRMAGVINNIAG
jgi:4a-hydroxytetrahydrobiopterin dehydratase